VRTLVHLSDLHFGRTDPTVIDPLIAAVHAQRPDCVVVSGDLTQRARPEEFRQARAFLLRLPSPQVVVPGNHDVPLYRVLERALEPFGNYRRGIDDDLEPAFIDDEIAVIGINTARAMSFKGGRINRAQIDSIRARIAALPKQMTTAMTKIVVTHHPFDLPDRPGKVTWVGRAQGAAGMDQRAASGIRQNGMSSSMSSKPVADFGAGRAAAAGARGVAAGRAAGARAAGASP